VTINIHIYYYCTMFRPYVAIISENILKIENQMQRFYILISIFRNKQCNEMSLMTAT